MKEKYKIKNKHIIYVFSLWIIFFWFLWINSFWRRITEDFFLKNYDSNNWNTKNIPNNLKDERMLLQIAKNIKNKKYETAEKYISWDTSEDYFNRGSIKLVQAYSLAKKDNLSWLQQARTLISQANNDLEIAKNIQLNNKLDNFIEKNLQTAKWLLTIIETKTCYQEWGTLLSEIKETLNETDKILEEQTKQLWRLKAIKYTSWDICIPNLINIITNNQIQLNNVKNDLNKRQQDYKNIIWEKLNSPAKCIWTSLEDTIKKTIEAKESMIKYLLQQLEISQILKNPTPEWINQLCNWSKNDNQLNENLSNSVSQMMKDLQKQSEKEKSKTWEPKEEQKDNKPGEKGEPKEKKDKSEGKDWDKKEKEEEGKQWDTQSDKWNWESEYKDVLEQQERNLLNQTQQNSNKLIQQMQQIKWQWSYNWYQYIKNLFNSFMWNEWDLKNLHETKTKKTESDWSSQESNWSSQTQRY